MWLKQSHCGYCAESQMKMGIDVEKEHASTYQWIKDTYEQTQQWPKETDVYQHIAQDHLNEFADYYTRLSKMEEEAKTALQLQGEK